MFRALHSNTQGKNMCKLFKQFGQFGNTFNRGVLLVRFLCSNSKENLEKIHMFDVQHCRNFAKVNACKSFFLLAVVVVASLLFQLGVSKRKENWHNEIQMWRTKNLAFASWWHWCVLRKSMRSRKAWRVRRVVFFSFFVCCHTLHTDYMKKCKFNLHFVTCPICNRYVERPRQKCGWKNYSKYVVSKQTAFFSYLEQENEWIFLQTKHGIVCKSVENSGTINRMQNVIEQFRSSILSCDTYT